MSGPSDQLLDFRVVFCGKKRRSARPVCEKRHDPISFNFIGELLTVNCVKRQSVRELEI